MTIVKSIINGLGGFNMSNQNILLIEIEYNKRIDLFEVTYEAGAPLDSIESYKALKELNPSSLKELVGLVQALSIKLITGKRDFSFNQKTRVINKAGIPAVEGWHVPPTNCVINGYIDITYKVL